MFSTRRIDIHLPDSRALVWARRCSVSSIFLHTVAGSAKEREIPDVIRSAQYLRDDVGHFCVLNREVCPTANTIGGLLP